MINCMLCSTYSFFPPLFYLSWGETFAHPSLFCSDLRSGMTFLGSFLFFLSSPSFFVLFLLETTHYFYLFSFSVWKDVGGQCHCNCNTYFTKIRIVHCNIPPYKITLLHTGMYYTCKNDNDHTAMKSHPTLSFSISVGFLSKQRETTAVGK